MTHYMYTCTYHSILYHYTQAITVLNHMGVCAPYKNAWKYLKSLTTEARYLEMIRSGHWMWAYDNLNLKQQIRHEREGSYVLYTLFNLSSF